MKSSDTVHMRLINGDEIIGELSEITDTEIKIKKPMVVSEREDPRTKMTTVILSKYVLFNENDAIAFQKGHVITLTDVMEEIKSYYQNSLEYNSKIIEPIIMKEIRKVNDMMVDILHPEMEIPVQGLEPTTVQKRIEPREDIRVVVIPTSNTIH